MKFLQIDTPDTAEKIRKLTIFLMILGLLIMIAHKQLHVPSVIGFCAIELGLFGQMILSYQQFYKSKKKIDLFYTLQYPLFMIAWILLYWCNGNNCLR